ncbi:hypothetical protein OE88DRAFT_1718715, partial [Heliocybe sulcata]
MNGHPKDSPEVRLGKTLSWLLRHGAQSEKIEMRPDGYVRVSDILASRKFQGVDFAAIEQVVKNNNKQRYKMVKELDPKAPTNEEVWWIRANQGHSIKALNVDMQKIMSASDIPTGIAVHGTSRQAWNTIAKKGLSKMSRNHIHLAQGVPGSGVISGMRALSQVLIYIDIQKALDAGIPFFLSDNGVVLTPGNAKGLLEPQFFRRVERVEGVRRVALPEWGDNPDPEFEGLERKAEQIVESMAAGNTDAPALEPIQSESTPSKSSIVGAEEPELVNKTEKLSV